ncbi:3-hydroxyacyl-CoA dehydrogenase/enoyl-CoA hydratase family protein [Paenibacillus sp. HB172176]|uniref:3-hydroxyacyl-CoA dehydrogenase/enoyl-CoA hydratase family protein n=1 Tax=Paenibacillus sp. HB172176 TaxID=2493690 RepID=UPI001F1066C0|nr:3-hydroxyacyl-CoA dehydrogenase/enoyl-CoA hydratase family protein [Paenibacillus sp. HB172176]
MSNSVLQNTPPKAFQNAAVIGAGVMGAGIAAHLANAGMKVLLLDIAPSALTDAEQRKGLTLQDPEVRNRLALSAIGAMGKSKPAQLYDAAYAKRIQAGNLSDDLGLLHEADWIVEAVVERLDAKREILAAVESHRKPGALVSTNTSGLSVEAMTEGRSEAFRSCFAATHFFNPPRYMKLVEIVPTKDTSAGTVAKLTELCERRLGKGVVLARDTPNFIANRIGSFGMLTALEDTLKFGLTIEEADALTGPALGRPKTATFRMLDLIGIDTLLHVVNNMRSRLESGEEKRLYGRTTVLELLAEQGRLGEKTGAGFYRKLRGENGQSRIEALRLDEMVYEEQRKPVSPVIEAAKTAKGAGAKARALLAAEPSHKHAQFVWSTLKRTLLFAASQVGVIAESISDIDRAMRWGFSWELGPFELWDAVGLPSTVKRMRQEGELIPEWIESWLAAGHTSFYSTEGGKRLYASMERQSQDDGPPWKRSPDGRGREGQGALEIARKEAKVIKGAASIVPRQEPEAEAVTPSVVSREERPEPDVISLSALRDAGRTVLSTPGASLIDIGDEVACLAFHSPNNAIGGDILAAIHGASEEVSRNWRGLVLANEGRNFCVGANLMLLLMEAQSGDWDEVEAIIRMFQGSMLRLKRLDRPVVAAPHRMTLGGGVEACLPADAIIVSPETYFGLVETGVGLIPAGGGCKEAALMAADRARAAAGGGRFTLAGLQPQLNAMFETIAMAKTSTSGREIEGFGLLRPQDRHIMRQDARIAEAKRAVLELDREGYRPQEERRIAVAGREGRAVLQVGVQAMTLSRQISEHDALIGRKLAHVLAGGDARAGAEVSEQYMLDLECEAFLSLCGESKTQERMRHMLTTGKPLRN